MPDALLTAEQVVGIEELIRQIGVDPDSSSVMAAQMRVGGTSAPYGYLVLTRSQALAMIVLMTRYIGERERSEGVVV